MNPVPVIDNIFAARQHPQKGQGTQYLLLYYICGPHPGTSHNHSKAYARSCQHWLAIYVSWNGHDIIAMLHWIYWNIIMIINTSSVEAYSTYHSRIVWLYACYRMAHNTLLYTVVHRHLVNGTRHLARKNTGTI
jgi:hypothetical protein